MPGTSWIQSSWLTLVLGAVLATPSSATTPDVWITTKTRLALLTTAGISWTGIHVDTVLGQVTLHGTVRSAAEKETAETVAQQIGGVQEGVRNLLEVVALQDERVVQVADDTLTPRVVQAVQADSALKNSRISVQAVNQSVVLLTGTAQTLSAPLRATLVGGTWPDRRKR